MRAPQAESWTRRRFLGGLTVAGAAGLLGLHPRPIAAEPPPETAAPSLLEIPALCWAPQYVAEELLRTEGFSRVHYAKQAIGSGMFQALGSGEAHLSMGIAGLLLRHIDAGDPIVILAGAHVGCYELFGTGRIRTIRDLQGKTVGVQGLGGGAHVTLTTMLAYVGVDPRQDVRWVAHPFPESRRLLADGKVETMRGHSTRLTVTVNIFPMPCCQNFFYTAG